MARDRLSEDQIVAALEGVAWTREGDEIARTVTLGDFAAALDFVNRVGAQAERLDHHPDIWISWNKVTLKVTTHSAGGLTELDFQLARLVDDLDR